MLNHDFQLSKERFVMKRLLATAFAVLVTSFGVSANARECPVITEVEVMAKCMQDAAPPHPPTQAEHQSAQRTGPLRGPPGASGRPLTS